MSFAVINDNKFVVLTSEQSDAIKAVEDNLNVLRVTPIFSKDYQLAVQRFITAVITLAKHHRNWNDVTVRPDGLYRGFYSIPGETSAEREPKVVRDNLSGIELTIEDILRSLERGKFPSPTLESAAVFDEIDNQVGNLISYHPQYDIHTGRIG